MDFIIHWISLNFLPLVSLYSSAARVCPGDTLVFTCVTDTGVLVWGIDGINHVFYEAGQSSQLLDIFTVNLINITGTTFVSTATVHNARIENNGTIITCSDNNNQMKTLEARISGIK